MNYEIDFINSYDNTGFVQSVEEDIIFGLRNVNTVTNTLSASYIFTKSMSLTLRVRHYHSKAAYKQYAKLGEEGYLHLTDYSDNHNMNFNVFNVDMVFSWFFAPGSEVRIVWKDASIQKNEQLIQGYFGNLKHILQSRQNNILSLKVLYYLDAGRWLRKFNR